MIAINIIKCFYKVPLSSRNLFYEDALNDIIEHLFVCHHSGSCIEGNIVISRMITQFFIINTKEMSLFVLGEIKCILYEIWRSAFLFILMSARYLKRFIPPNSPNHQTSSIKEFDKKLENNIHQKRSYLVLSNLSIDLLLEYQYSNITRTRARTDVPLAALFPALLKV